MTTASSPPANPSDMAAWAASLPKRTVDAADLLVLTKFLALLPGVMPRVTKDWLRDLMVEAVISEKTDFEVETELVSMAEANEFFLSDDWNTDHVSPMGAQTLIRLYQAGVLPMKWVKPRPVPTEVSAYAASQAALEQRARERRERQRAEYAAYQAKLADPASVTEEEFSYRLLNDNFWRHIGKGEGTLAVGGLAITKSLVGYASNSGKNRDFSVDFTWVSPSQGERSISKQSSFESNRRNDEARNWGLPE